MNDRTNVSLIGFSENDIKNLAQDIINNINQNKKGKIVSFLIHGDYFVGNI